jgi:hypothetical protein
MRACRSKRQRPDTNSIFNVIMGLAMTRQKTQRGLPLGTTAQPAGAHRMEYAVETRNGEVFRLLKLQLRARCNEGL